MFNDESNIFSLYLEIIEEAFVRKKDEPSQISGGTRKYGLTTGLTASTSTKPESSPEEEKSRRDVIYNNAIDEAIASGRILNIVSEFSDNKDVSKFLGELNKIPGKNILKNRENEYEVYWMDYPKVIAFLNMHSDKGADILKSAFINKMKSDPVWSQKLGFKKFSNKSIEEFSKDQKNWWYSMPMKEVEGGTGVKQQGSFLKVRSDVEGRGSEANIMPKGGSKSESKYLRKKFGEEGVDAPIIRKNPLRGPEPHSKGIEKILAPKKLKKESYKSFIKIIPF